MKKHFVVVAYDLPNDRRRTKLHTLLEDYGTPVQYSVFECLLTEKEMATMKKRIKRLIKPRLDQVRYYHLCASCQRRIETTEGSVDIVDDEDDAWVVG